MLARLRTTPGSGRAERDGRQRQTLNLAIAGNADADVERSRRR